MLTSPIRSPIDWGLDMRTEAEWSEMRERYRQGVSISQIAKEGLSRNTVRKYVQTDVPPAYVRSRTCESKLEPFKPYIRQRLWAFAMVLGYSRMRFVRFTTDAKTPTFISCHMDAFDYFGGYTKSILYDNTKNVVLKRALRSSDSQWNPQFQDFFTHYDFKPRLCKPGLEGAKTKGKLVIGADHKDLFALEAGEVKRILEGARDVGGWKGAVTRFSVAMMTFLRLRPGELQKASLKDLDTRKWNFLVANPKGKGIYGEEARLPIPDVLRPYVLEYLVERQKMLKSRGIGDVPPLVPAISTKGVNVYTQQAFGRLRKVVIAKTGISFKWKDFRATGGQIALDSGVSIEQVSRSMRHASVVTTERYYCRARADLAYARVNDAYNSVFEH